MELKDRYNRNLMTLSPEENLQLKNFKICVVGCGGLGGYIIELLGRLGIGSITAIDGDVFDVTNLNRQLLSTENSIGKSKAYSARERMKTVNSEVKVIAVDEFLTDENCNNLIKGHDVVVDALDNMPARKILEKYCEELNIPMVHGAIAGWYGQVCTIMPGDKTLEKIYLSDDEKGDEAELGNPSFIPSLVASLQVAEVVKLLFKKGEVLQGKLMTIDLLNNEYEIFTI
ncbi:HesA/MoeB/ThiF family protein [Anaerovorax odorimutans]|uniref:HesA/MoeB/ThiF family protein n=1 Tax=Anaerovorax odorimutans TaxID=109327 RepID=UPI0004085655|nr:HesA/MoeB/ThiF family protein [Anaerovorax odorimutans]